MNRITPSIGLVTALCAVAIIWPAEASAQRSVGAFRATVFFVTPAYGYGYAVPFWWGPWGPHPYSWYTPFFGRPPFVSSARLQVKPRNAEVYVDGHRAGVVDEFDGFFQRLDVPPGGHEVSVYLEGYKTFTQKVLFRPGATITIRHEMQPLAPGETAEPRPKAAERFGTLAVRVKPADAVVVINGQEWTTEGDRPMLIELREGTHDVEVRKDGFATYRRSVRVRAGETVPLNVSLSR